MDNKYSYSEEYMRGYNAGFKGGKDYILKIMVERFEFACTERQGQRRLSGMASLVKAVKAWAVTE